MSTSVRHPVRVARGLSGASHARGYHDGNPVAALRNHPDRLFASIIVEGLRLGFRDWIGLDSTARAHCSRWAGGCRVIVCRHGTSEGSLHRPLCRNRGNQSTHQSPWSGPKGPRPGEMACHHQPLLPGREER